MQTNGSIKPTNWAERADWPGLLLGELLLFGLLGKLLYTYPREDWLTDLVADNLFDDAPFAAKQADVQLGLSLLQSWQQCFDADPQISLSDLQAAYTRLFIMPGDLPISPYESAYFNADRMLFEERTLQVRGWYRRFDLELVNVRREPDDHIGLELAFVALLARRALQALNAADDVLFAETLDAQRAFCRQHLFSWAFWWCNQVVQFSRSDFYQGVALVLRGALAQLALVLDEAQVEVAAS